MAQPPKFKFNDEGKMLLYKILKNDHAATALANEIQYVALARNPKTRDDSSVFYSKYSGKEDEIVTETKARKQIYQKVWAPSLFFCCKIQI